ncbi:hypothetical protein BSL78_20963 [Apostichopus japonicus]|uniref:Uncharacterized protein n=1 Tax=Stichopus japonicus TaxID=307972 RepID=A0A2G8K2G6_STIJA|nr:hypothetical protein BSL78_20963 [Apostichopus japonicus]
MGSSRGLDDPRRLSIRAVTQRAIGQTHAQNPVSGRGRLGSTQKLPPRPHPPTGFTRFEPGGVRLLPDPHFLPKNQTVTFTPNEIFLPSFVTSCVDHERQALVPVRALKWYIERTKQLKPLTGSSSYQGHLSPRPERTPFHGGWPTSSGPTPSPGNLGARRPGRGSGGFPWKIL